MRTLIEDIYDWKVYRQSRSEKEIEKSGNKPSFLAIAEKLAVQLSEIEYIISCQSLEQMGELMKIVTSEDYEEAREKIDLRFTK